MECALCHLKFYPISTSKGLYGQNVLSSYAKAVDSAHSSVRVTSSRQTNDVLGKQIKCFQCKTHLDRAPVFFCIQYVHYYVIYMLVNYKVD